MKHLCSVTPTPPTTEWDTTQPIVGERLKMALAEAGYSTDLVRRSLPEGRWCILTSETCGTMTTVHIPQEDAWRAWGLVAQSLGWNDYPGGAAGSS